MKIVTPDSIKYVQQTEALNEIAAKLEAVAYRPSYHGSKGDKNTVMFYTPEDAEHNRLVAQQPVQYTRIEAANRKKLDGVAVPDEFIYRDSFWSFENSDVNGLFNVGYANHGRLNLQQPDWKDRLEGHIGFTLLRRRQHQYLRMTGGWDALREADETYNNFNRSIIAYMKKAYGQLYLGSVNYYGEHGEQLCAGNGSVYEEYTGQMVYNFACSFAVPEKDERLEKMIRGWNTGAWAVSMEHSSQITERIYEIDGECFIWY